MIHSLFIDPLASQEINEAFDWYEEKKTGLGEEFYESIQALFDQLEAQPLRYPIKVTHKDASKSQRQANLKRFPYIIRYRVFEDLVVILAVAHNKRSPKNYEDR